MRRCDTAAGSCQLKFELELARVHGGACSRGLAGVHRTERLGRLGHGLLGRKGLQHHGRALSLVEHDLQPRGGHPRRRPVGRFDARQQRIESVGVDVGEPDDTYVHRGTSWAGLARPYTRGDRATDQLLAYSSADRDSNSKATKRSSPTTQASCPGSMMYASPVLSSRSVPSSWRTAKRPEETTPT